MNTKKEKNYAFIDGRNLFYNTTKNVDAPWRVDLKRFRIYLLEKYSVDIAYYFVGSFNIQYKALYNALCDYGYELIFREHDEKSKSGKKGNVDTDIVFLAMKKIAEREKFDKVLLVSNDGDYFRMVNYLIDKGKFKKILVPRRENTSRLYKTKIGDNFVDYLDKKDIKNKIMLKEE